jgi:calcium permeable stress-gated cation channel
MQHSVGRACFGSMCQLSRSELPSQIIARLVNSFTGFFQPFTMYNKWLEANPKDVIWANLDDPISETTTRYVLSWLATFGLIILWAFPVTAIGALSKLDQLCQDVQ